MPQAGRPPHLSSNHRLRVSGKLRTHLLLGVWVLASTQLAYVQAGEAEKGVVEILPSPSHPAAGQLWVLEHLIQC